MRMAMRFGMEMEREIGVDWAELPPEIIEIISKSLIIYGDYLRFRAVCRNWRSPVPKTPNHLPPQLPWLMLPLHHCPTYQSRRAFFDLSNNRTHFLNLPEASHRRRNCGSSHGWLVILDDTPEILLVNPLTRAKVHLPSLCTFPSVINFNYSDVGREYVLRNYVGQLYTLNLRQMRNSYIKKIILSSSPLQSNEFTALAILTHTGNLAFCKNGDQSWTLIDEQAQYHWEDAVYHNGLFYAVNKRGLIAVCDVKGLLPPRVSIIDAPGCVDGDLQYLVFSGEELLLVIRYLEPQYDDMVGDSNLVYRTVGFSVFKMNWNMPEWLKIETLGDRMLFIGENSSLSLSASDFSGCSGDCIYYTDDYSESNYDGAFEKHDLGIYRLWDQIIDSLPCYPRNTYTRLGGPSPVWVSPNPC
ncbi:hypothetical protein L6164_015218 [Bauhinia variegata]|uniref:Uncharacterized protein n=1 Tax=Bauhinia variegata TaxID=167791 RepID=A0ACB9NKI2_BAUVA|nr:hypothetical protein L6164_015218 [Bauhinia variegata]